MNCLCSCFFAVFFSHQSLKPLEALAVGYMENSDAQRMYDSMISIARSKGQFDTSFSFQEYRDTDTVSSFLSFSPDWNTASDEDSVPQMKQVSCAALAYYLYHSGLAHLALTHTGKPTRQLVEVYRAVFALRKQVFLHRPVPDGEGKVSDCALLELYCVLSVLCFL